jgi:hypothetical protein
MFVLPRSRAGRTGGIRLNSATRLTVSKVGVVAVPAGMEHGIGEVRQGNVAPDGVTILSWPELEFFSILTGEPAMTLVPNLLVTGVLAILVSAVSLPRTTMFIGGSMLGWC